MDTRFEKLEKLVSELKISDKELINWVNNRDKHDIDLIPTELPLVYRSGNVLTTQKGLDLNRRNELWGIQLLSGTMVALKCVPEDNVPKTSWKHVKDFAQTMKFNGLSGLLPSKDVVKKHWGEEERTAFEATVDVLKKYNISVDHYCGCIWCCEEYDSKHAFYFHLRCGSTDWFGKKDIIYIRVALTF